MICRKLEKKRDDIEQKLQLCRKEMETLGQQIDENNSAIMEHLNENATMKAKLEKYNTMLSQSNVKKAELTQRILRSKTEEAICAEKLETEEKKYKEVTSEIEEKKESISQLRSSLQESRQQLEELRKTYGQKQQDYHREKSRLEALKNMTERYDGYGQSIRRVMEQKDKNPGIVGDGSGYYQSEKRI